MRVLAAHHAVVAMAELEKKQKVLPPGLLQSALRSWSVCAEGFIAARARMARSLATLSVAQYLLGVGDRHLSNFMIDTTWYVRACVRASVRALWSYSSISSPHILQPR
jgi:hypothetical protein